jgi:hypothetical protein
VIKVEVCAKTRARARKEGTALGKLHGSVTGGRGNTAGMLGEILAHKLLGGERVGDKCFAYDLILENGLTVDVKTGRGEKEPQPHYVARVYAPEGKRDIVGSKCDVYFFLRANSSHTTAWILGWMWADHFVEQATFMPRGHIGADGKLTYSDEWVVPISALNPPSMPIKPRRGHAKRKRERLKEIAAKEAAVPKAKAKPRPKTLPKQKARVKKAA